MLVDVTMGVSGLGRDNVEHSGITKLRRFSYKANKFSRRGGTEDDLCVSGIPVVAVVLKASHSLVVEVADLKDVNGDTAAIATASPLGDTVA